MNEKSCTPNEHPWGERVRVLREALSELQSPGCLTVDCVVGDIDLFLDADVFADPAHAVCVARYLLGAAGQLLLQSRSDSERLELVREVLS